MAAILLKKEDSLKPEKGSEGMACPCGSESLLALCKLNTIWPQDRNECVYLHW